MDNYGYTDAFGRPLAKIYEGEGEAGKQWVVSGLAEYDRKGALRRRFLPFYYSGNPLSFPLTEAPETVAGRDVQYGRRRYDAFGRQVQTYVRLANIGHVS